MNPPELGYTKEHEWARFEADGTATVGITEFAQDQLGDIVYFELPKVGAQLAQGGEFGEVESVKSVSVLYSPLSGEVVAVNDALRDAPETANAAPYGDGWIIKLKVANPSEREGLLSAEEYEASTK